ncbi:uncharacterized protein LOC132272835 [Cornus florida]|uniref:uncharacterized protein LOC132272835 n=1 Tax=Cornus florida TaxID=4283 RepID=UPI00289EDE50|nr:uncharacterized protein LOC132272835 [Cornus florida]
MSLIKKRRSRNTISGVFDAGNHWVVEENAVQSVFLSYFQDLFQSSSPSTIDQFLRYVPIRISDEMNANLMLAPIELEVKLFCRPRKLDCYLDFIFVGEHLLCLIFFFADDSIVFCATDSTEVGVLKRILNDYEWASRQQVNFSKSSIFFSRNVPMPLRRSFSHALGLPLSGFHSRYLGVPAILGRSKRDVFQFLLTNIQDRLSFWKAKAMSTGGEAVLIKAVLSALPTYVMSSFKLPITMCQDLMKCIRSFWWCFKNKSWAIHWLHWKFLCRSKSSGGLGFRNLETFNLALLSKHAWHFQVHKQGLLYQFFKAKYFPSSSFLEAPLGYNPSWGWRSIWSTQALLCQGVRSLIRNGLSTDVWNDHWVLTLPHKLPPPRVPAPFSSMAELIDPVTSSWKLDVLSQVFSPTIVQEILKIHISHWDKPDEIIWSPERSGKFSMRSAYQLAMSGDSFLGVASPIGSWSSIWSCRILSKVWKLSPLRFDFSDLSFSSFRVGWRFPVHKAMVSSDFANVISLISFCVWGIWKARNRLVFKGILWRPKVVVQKAVVSFWEFHDARSLCSSVQPWLASKLVESWSPPPSGVVKCNFDAVFCRQSSQGGGAAVFRDSRGVVLRAVIFRPFSAASALEAKALVCQRAILCAIDLHFFSLWFESYAKVVVDGVLCQLSCPSEIASICFDIARDLRRFLSAQLTHVRRQGNRVVHALTTLSRSGVVSDMWLSSVLLSVIPFVVAEGGS